MKQYKLSRSVSYLFKTIYEEFIEITRDKVILIIIRKIKTMKYYYIIVNSASDISHVDQLYSYISFFHKRRYKELLLKNIFNLLVNVVKKHSNWKAQLLHSKKKNKKKAIFWIFRINYIYMIILLLKSQKYPQKFWGNTKKSIFSHKTYVLVQPLRLI